MGVRKTAILAGDFTHASARRLWSKIDRRSADACWPWTCGLSHGYGALRIGHGHNSDAVDIVAGQHSPTAGVAVRKVADAPPREWAVVSVDLWDVFKKPLRIQAMGLIAAGGAAAFDQILLKRAPEVVPPVRK